MDIKTPFAADVFPAAHFHPHLMSVRDIEGSYLIPYLVTGRCLCVHVDFAALPVRASQATVVLQGYVQNTVMCRPVGPDAPLAEFVDLLPGEYVLSVSATDSADIVVWQEQYGRIGIGTVVAALGDSLTEGYHGHGFKRPVRALTADVFPPDAVSQDGRNFPQFAPTAAQHKPSVNCFQSWMTRLNNGLTDAWQQPVFIANEGWGGYTSGEYAQMMRSNHGGWRDRMHLLQPTVWLIHLGVNDERKGVEPQRFDAHMRSIIETLQQDFNASSQAVYIARPSYDYATGAASILRDYIAVIDNLIADLGVRHGPDFFAAFAVDKGHWYGSDPVHPGPAGMDRMADLWLDALDSAPPEGSVAPAMDPLTVPQNPSGIESV